MHIWQLGMHCWLCGPRSNLRLVQNYFKYAQCSLTTPLHRTVWWLGCLLVLREKHFNRRLSCTPPLPLLPWTFILPGFLEIKSVCFQSWFRCYFRAPVTPWAGWMEHAIDLVVLAQIGWLLELAQIGWKMFGKDQPNWASCISETCFKTNQTLLICF